MTMLSGLVFPPDAKPTRLDWFVSGVFVGLMVASGFVAVESRAGLKFAAFEAWAAGSLIALIITFVETRRIYLPRVVWTVLWGAMGFAFLIWR